MTLTGAPNWLLEWAELLPGVRASRALAEKYVPADGCRCGAFGPLASNPDFGYVHGARPDEPPELPWDRLLRMDMLARDSMSYVGGKRDFLESWFLPYVMHNWREAMTECPHGTVYLMLVSLDVMQDWVDLDAARRFFAVSVALGSLVQSVPCHLQFSVLQLGFVGNSFLPNFERLPFLLGC